MPFPDLPDSLLSLEDEVLHRWRDEDLFRRTLEATADGEPFVFYEGPPTANGRPGLHHIISRTIKDLVCRHRTMRGHRVTRIAGWDTHGLPVEIEAEKRLGISGKPEIEEVGIARFNEVCRESVFTYKEEWEELSERIGYWLDYSDPYVTFHPEYIESVWWVLKELAERGLLYRGHKSVPYCPRCGTALSSHEVAQGYREVEDPSLHFLCEVVTGDGEPDPHGRAFLVWTTTPWTVPSNAALAIHPELEYVEVETDGRRLILAAARKDEVLGEEAPVVATHTGADLVGLHYRRPLEWVEVPETDADPDAGHPSTAGGPAAGGDPSGAGHPTGWRVYGHDFVSAEDGTGIVHMAPAFGADDYQAGLDHDLPLLRPVDDEGRFRDPVEAVGGLWVKDADPVVVEGLEERGLLHRAGRMTHSYPHCWRCDSPLIYMARDSWFAATSSLKDRMLENNARVSWLPPEVGEGRFGEWLRGNVDWALSRDRFWGTPLPVWLCDEEPDHVEWIGGLDELAERVGGLPDDFDPHRPFIDELTWPCPGCDGTMRRTEGVVDVWFDSGSMPYAQWHYPFENREAFEDHFPADFICEGLDQTRGWFYSLMAISSMLDLGPAYRTVVVNGLILDAEGQKMSKSKGNAVDPWEALSRHGADALRWYLVTVSNPWVAKRYDDEGVEESTRKFFDTLLNTYRFFALYAGVEGWDPDGPSPGDHPSAGDHADAADDRTVLDRWILSRLDGLIREVEEALEAYQITRAYRAVGLFVDEELSNWYVRRSRSRFWGKGEAAAVRAAFRTLHTCLRTVALLIAPVAPFTADWLHRALTGESVHLAPFPGRSEEGSDAALEEEMETARVISTLGRAAREEVGIRVRQPLRTLHAVLSGGAEPRAEVLDLVRDELNVKEVSFTGSSRELVRLTGRPDYTVLGPRFQQQTEAVAAAVRAAGEEALAALREGRPLRLEVGGEEIEVTSEEVEIVEEARGDLVVRSEGGVTVALDPALDEALRAEGLARELVNRIQRLRRDAGLEVTDRIRLGIFGPDPVREAVGIHRDFIAGETLAVEVEVEASGTSDGYQAEEDVDLDGVPASLALARAGD